MLRFFFINPILETISKGKFFRQGFSWILKIIAVLLALGGLFLFITNFRFIGQLGFWGAIGLIIAQIFLLIAVWIIIQIMWNRARFIVDLADSDFTIIPILSIVLKMTGEIYATILMLLSLSGAILTWFLGYSGRLYLYQLREFAPFLRSGTGLLGGLALIGIGFIAAFLALFVFYLLAEALVVCFDTAKNVKLIVDSKK